MREKVSTPYMLCLPLTFCMYPLHFVSTPYSLYVPLTVCVYPLHCVCTPYIVCVPLTFCVYPLQFVCTPYILCLSLPVCVYPICVYHQHPLKMIVWVLFNISCPSITTMCAISKDTAQREAIIYLEGVGTIYSLCLSQKLMQEVWVSQGTG